MPATPTYDLVAAATGNIEKLGLVYTATTGAMACQTHRDNVSGSEGRCYLTFLTESLPDDATVSLVELWQVLRDPQPVGAPEIWELEYWLGNVGATLDGTAGEWTSGTRVLVMGAPAESDVWIDLGASAPALVNLSGYTTVKLVDTSSQGTGDPEWWVQFNDPAHSGNCMLRVTYSSPQTIGLDKLSMIFSAAQSTIEATVTVLVNTITLAMAVRDARITTGVVIPVDKLGLSLSVLDTGIVPGPITIGVERLTLSMVVRDIIRLGGTLQLPDGRTVVVGAEDRVIIVGPEDRIVLVEAEDRLLAVAAEDRTIGAEPEDRTVGMGDDEP